ncbi:transposase [Streptomyces sp. Wh19]|uniref:transposase n=1 Tax=Streptomyces sp. Wh19 TaxID=3076629 RepID=UPI002958AF58|nr:transposase [Streptomyces sp. Wh19]MDV9194588.1 hypothetical protein [Streptomyces sp. Wh19]
MARIDLRGVVVTADAMHTQRKTGKKIVAAGGHYLLVVKGNQKKLRQQLPRPPWRQMSLLDRTRTAGHGRREVRRLKVCTVDFTEDASKIRTGSAPPATRSLIRTDSAPSTRGSRSMTGRQR